MISAIVAAAKVAVTEGARETVVMGANKIMEGRLLEGALKEIGESPIKTMMTEINDVSLETLKLQNEIWGDAIREGQVEAIRDSSPFSESINQYIRNTQELDIYKEANLQEKEVNGQEALVRKDIEWDQLDDFGRKNSERTADGLSPLDTEGRSVELHHIGQEADSPFAELRFSEHRGENNFSTLHRMNESKIDREAFGAIREEYWKTRSAEL